MNCFIAEWRPLAEFAYFVSGILLLAGVGLAFFQLRAVRQDSHLRIKRSASERAIEAADRYYSKYLPTANTFYLLRVQKGLGTYDGPVGDFSQTSLPQEKIAECHARFNEMTWGDHLNQLELISSMLASGVGDEKTAFEIIGRSFCSAVTEHYDIISICRPHQPHPYFKYTVEIFQIWSERLKKEELVLQRNGLDSKILGIRDRRLPPLERRDG